MASGTSCAPSGSSWPERFLKPGEGVVQDYFVIKGSRD